MSVSLSLGLLIIRLVGGLTIAVHGAQKLFGWFDGSGLTKTRQGQEQMGFKPALLWAGLAILGELGGGLSIAFGFLTPLGAAGMFGAMFMAIIKVHWKNGFLSAKRGFEYPLALLALGIGIGLTGPGSYSLDALLSITLPTLLFIVLAVAALLVDIVGIRMSRGEVAAPPGAIPRA